MRDTFGDAEFHFTWKNEDIRKLSSSTSPEESFRSYVAIILRKTTDRPHCSTSSQPKSSA